MYYIEFFSRNPGVELDRFHRGVQDNFDHWQQLYPQDELIMMIGRTFRMGPQPNYMAVWRAHSFARLDEWKAAFDTSPEAARAFAEFAEVATIEYAGVYEDFGEEQL
jgi:hypothetical protein